MRPTARTLFLLALTLPTAAAGAGDDWSFSLSLGGPYVHHRPYRYGRHHGPRHYGHHAFDFGYHPRHDLWHDPVVVRQPVYVAPPVVRQVVQPVYVQPPQPTYQPQTVPAAPQPTYSQPILPQATTAYKPAGEDPSVDYAGAMPPGTSRWHEVTHAYTGIRHRVLVPEEGLRDVRKESDRTVLQFAAGTVEIRFLATGRVAVRYGFGAGGSP